ncbi:hypothetical protein LC612_24010 [Nostoc sp. CHAB 5834]|nr:hypothetical protein [Nostoc sp. CHAB 5834]
MGCWGLGAIPAFLTSLREGAEGKETLLCSPAPLLPYSPAQAQTLSIGEKAIASGEHSQ